jgi:hypothetical protein
MQYTNAATRAAATTYDGQCGMEVTTAKLPKQHTAIALDGLLVLSTQGMGIGLLVSHLNKLCHASCVVSWHGIDRPPHKERKHH